MSRTSGWVPAICAIALSGCFPQRINTHLVSSAYVSTPGIVIRAEDGSYELKSNVPFVPTRASECYNYTARSGLREGALISQYPAAIALGAKRIRLMQEGRSEPLYGVLLFCDVPNGAIGASARSYDIRVPQERIDETSGGRVTYTYESVLVPLFPELGWDKFGWVLWLSDRPL